MFAMDFHHIISDGTSVSVICNDIALAYDGKELEPEKFSQLDLSVFEEKLEETEEYQKSKNYYDSIFSAVESKSEITEDLQRIQRLRINRTVLLNYPRTENSPLRMFAILP